MLNFIYISQCKWYLRLKINVQGPFKENDDDVMTHKGRVPEYIAVVGNYKNLKQEGPLAF